MHLLWHLMTRAALYALALCIGIALMALAAQRFARKQMTRGKWSQEGPLHPTAPEHSHDMLRPYLPTYIPTDLHLDFTQPSREQSTQPGPPSGGARRRRRRPPERPGDGGGP